MSDPFDSINALESTHYSQGYADGHAHGALHGLYEGRELGQEKCFEWWEELGFLEGQAQFWRRLASSQGGEGKKISPRTLKSIDQLVDLINSFPTINPTPSATTDLSTEPSETPSTTDLPSLITRIRAKYRLICSALGVKPRLAVRQSVEGDVMQDRGPEDADAAMEGVEGVDRTDNGKAKGEGIQGVTDGRLLQF